MTYQDSPYRQRPRHPALAAYEDSPYQDPAGYQDGGYQEGYAYAQQDYAYAQQGGSAYQGGYSAGYQGQGHQGQGHQGPGYQGQGYQGPGYQGPGGYPDAFDGAGGYRSGYQSQQDGYRNQQTAYLDAFDGSDARGYGSGVAYRDPHPSFPDGWVGYQDDYPGRGGYQDTGYQDTGYQNTRYQDTMVAPRPGAGVPSDFGGDENENRGGLGMVVGSVTGVLAAAVVLGVATLAAGFMGRQASPVSAIDGIFTAHVPSALRSSAAQHFGGHTRLVLLLGMYLVVAIIAMVIGTIARHSRAFGVMGIGAFGLLAAYVVISRPGSQAADVIPAVIGALAGVAALLYLVRSSLPYTEAA